MPLSKTFFRIFFVISVDPDTDWSDYDVVYICTPWDYQDNVDEFLAVLEEIDASSATLVNSLELVHWNLEKDYLRDLERRGAAIVPSLFRNELDASDVPSWFESHRTGTVVVKPLVGANADHITVVSKPVSEDAVVRLRETYSSRPFFVQPFMEYIVSEGEYSTFFFNGEYSHTILKKPAVNDFRTQEEHGAEILGVAAPQTLIDTARDVVARVQPQPVYVRADFVRDERDRFLLMELELIEPALYLRTDPGSAARFARAVNEWFEVLTRK